MPLFNYPPQPPPTPRSDISPRWILGALGITMFIALICGYLVICGVFYQGQWQLALTPSRTVTQTPSIPYTQVQFGTDASGQPQLYGWFLPAANATPLTRTALVLHAGVGSISNTLPTAALFHDAGLNVFVFDYRGFGHSGGKHPTQRLMREDAASALNYLTETLSTPLNQIVIVGEGIGAPLAIQLCEQHSQLHSLVLIDARGDIDRDLAAEPRASLVPAHMLFHEEFPLAEPLRDLRTPKLLITHTTGPTPQAIRQAADPKVTVELPLNAPWQFTLEPLKRFLSDSNL